MTDVTPTIATVTWEVVTVPCKSVQDLRSPAACVSVCRGGVRRTATPLERTDVLKSHWFMLGRTL